MLNFREKFGVGFIIGLILLMMVGIVGWVMNLYKLIHCDFEQPYKAEIVRTIGLIPVVGAFTGYMNLGN